MSIHDEPTIRTDPNVNPTLPEDVDQMALWGPDQQVESTSTPGSDLHPGNHEQLPGDVSSIKRPPTDGGLPIVVLKRAGDVAVSPGVMLASTAEATIKPAPDTQTASLFDTKSTESSTSQATDDSKITTGEAISKSAPQESVKSAAAPTPANVTSSDKAGDTGKTAVTTGANAPVVPPMQRTFKTVAELEAEHKDRGLRAFFRKTSVRIGGAATAAAIAGGFLVPNILPHSSDESDAKAPDQGGDAGASAGTFGVGSESSSVDLDAGTATIAAEAPARSPERTIAVGNFDLSDSLYTAPQSSDDTIYVYWGDVPATQKIDLHKQLGPANHTPTQEAASIMNQFSAVLAGRVDPHDSQLLSYFTDDPKVAKTMAQMNELFQNVDPSHRYQGMPVFYDLASAPVEFEEGLPDYNGHPTLQMKPGTGPLYYQRIQDSKGAWQNSAMENPNKAMEITGIYISYEPSANGYTSTVKDITFFGEGGVAISLDQLAQLPAS